MRQTEPFIDLIKKKKEKSCETSEKKVFRCLV